MPQPAKEKYEAEPLLKVDSAAEAAARGKNRTYPNLPLEKALAVAQAIQDGASGMPVNRVNLAELMGNTPGSSTFGGLLQASRMYGLTNGGFNATTFELTERGALATGIDDDARVEALRQAVLSIDPYRLFINALDNKRVPAASVCKDWLIKSAKVPAERAEECFQFLLADIRFVSFIRVIKGNEYIILNGSPAPAAAPASGPLQSQDDETYDDAPPTEPPERPSLTVVKPIDEQPPVPAKPKKVFIVHGKDHGPMEQVKKMLDEFKVPCAVALDEPHEGRPISAKVANLMRNECSSAIVIFSADERFLKDDGTGNVVEVWRPSENVVFELGAASILYDRRIVIFKDKRVVLPSDFSDLGYIPFEEGQIEMQMMQLVRELVAMNFLQVTATA